MKLRRTAKRTLLLGGAGMILLWLAHTGPAKELARQAVTGLVAWAVEGPVSIGAIDYRLWRGEIELSTVSLQPDPGVLPFL